MAKLQFTHIKISAITTTVGDKQVFIEDEAVNFGYDEKTLQRLKRSMGFSSRFVLSNSKICTSDLCLSSAENIFSNTNIKKGDIDGLLFISQTPDYKAPSTAIILQDRLGLSIDTLAYDINLGCSGFVYGLSTIYSLINSGLKKVLLCVGDVASQFAHPQDKSLTPLMGDAGSAIIVEKVDNYSKSSFVLHSDGSGFRYLMIPQGGARDPFIQDSLKPKYTETGIRRGVDMIMDGSEIFNFTLERVPNLFNELLTLSNVRESDIDYFVLHQANRYILQNIVKKMDLNTEKVPMDTMTYYGNQNSASIPGTINGYLSDKINQGSKKVIFAGFGIGLSWAACALDIDKIYAPKTLIYQENI